MMWAYFDTNNVWKQFPMLAGMVPINFWIFKETTLNSEISNCWFNLDKFWKDLGFRGLANPEGIKENPNFVANPHFFLLMTIRQYAHQADPKGWGFGGTLANQKSKVANSPFRTSSLLLVMIMCLGGTGSWQGSTTGGCQGTREFSSGHLQS